MKAAFLPRCDGATLKHYARRSTAVLAAITALFFVGAINDARAQSFREWTGSGTNWNDSANWNPSGITYAQLEWKGNGNATSWNNAGTQSQWRFYFSGGKAYTLGGDPVQFFDNAGTNGGILSDSSVLQTINMNISLRDNNERTAFIMTRGAGGITFGGGVEVTNSVTTLGIGGTNSGSIISFNGVVSGSKPIVIGTNSFAGNTTDAGETRVVFAGNNTYTGATTVERGALTITHANALGTSDAGTTVKANAVLRMSGGITVASEALTLSGGGFAESGALRSMSESNNYDGLITLSGGNTFLAAASGATLKVSEINGGANELWIVGDGTTILGSGATNSVAGTALVKSNVGTLILSASNAWSGSEFIREGTVVLNHNNALGVGGTTTLGATAGGATATLRYGSNITNSNAVTIQATGTGQRTFSYQTASGTGQQAGAVTLNNNLTVDVASGGTFNISGVLSGTGNGLAKTSAGVLALSGDNSYTGATTISAGTLRLGASDRISSSSAISVATDATFDLNSFSDTVGAISGAGNITLGSGTLTTSVGAASTFSGTLSGSGGLTKNGNGTLTLSGSSGSFTGATTVTNGTLVVNGSIAGSAVSVGNATTENGSVLMGTGTVGATTIDNNGRISPGNSVGILTVSNSLTLNNGGSYLWEINGTNGPAGTTWDLISVDTATVGNGTLNLPGSGTFIVAGVAIDGFTFDGEEDYTGNYFQIIRAGTVTGGLDNLSFSSSGLGAGSWSFATNNTGLFLNYAALGLEIVFNNSAAADQGGENIVVGNNAANAYATITDDGGVTAVVISNSAPMTFTNGANSYSGTTKIEQGTLVTTANAPNGANGAFGNAISTVDVGSTSVGNANTATLLIGSGGVTVGRGITIVAGGTGTRTVGATNDSGTAAYSGGVLMNTNVTLSASNAAGTTLFSGSLSGAGAVSIAGPGTVVLSGNNSFTNSVSVANGSTIVASNNNALGGAGGAATTVSSGGTLGLAGGISTAENITIAGTGVGGNGALRNVNGANTNTGTITVSADATISADTSTTLQLNSVNISGAANRNVTFAGAGNTLLTGGVTTFGADLTNRIIKSGAGSLIISNNGTTGNGQVRIGEGSVIIAGGSLTASRNTEVRAIDLGLSGASTGLATANNVSLLARAGVTVSNSVYVAPNEASATRTLGTDSTTGTATFTNQIFLGGNLRLTSAGTANAVFSGNITNTATHSLTKIGGGTVTLSGANTYGGTAVVEEGTLALSNSSALADTVAVAVNGGTLAVNSSETIGALSGNSSGTVALNAALVTSFNDASSTYEGVFTGANNLSKSGTGTLTLSGDSENYEGAVILNNGTLRIGNAGALGTGTLQIQFDQAGTRTLASSSTAGHTLANNVNIFNTMTLGQTTGGTGSLELSGAVSLGDPVGEVNSRTVTVNGSHTLSGAIGGGNGLVKAGDGTLTLSGGSANTYTGLTTVSAGTLALNKSSGNAIVGNVTVNSGAVLLLSSSNQVDSGATDVVTLSGGTIRRASGVTEAFGDLNVTQASFLDFSGGTGGTIEFSGLDYTPSALLSLQLVNFTQGNTLIIRNTSNWSTGPSTGFTFGGTGGFGGSTFSDGTFTITAIPEPSTYVAAAGLLALLVWPVRRRMIKDLKSILGLRPTGRKRIEAYRNA